MSAGDLLPLFPLELVLLPGAPLPLHIFEPRYRLMVGRAAEEKSEFGIALVSKGKLESVGCTAVVEEVTKRHEDGRFDVLTRGVRRFRTLSLDDSQPFLQARVEYFDDEPGPRTPAAAAQRLFALANEAAQLAGTGPLRDFDPEDPRLSFQVGAGLPLDAAIKQELLASVSETKRVASLSAYLAAWIKRSKTLTVAKGKAERNGRAR